MVKPRIRCAIYTRKSSEGGLEQGFNSLDAQHEACTAYIASQKQEGWVLAQARFDDGGVSGGTLDRPALQKLLAEVDAGRIGMVVVYKIDRLTRSLADFVKLVERLDAAGCSFVSVTQAFNTASSMGRLTLNVLLSFAQFEREVTAERIRDKIAASKKQGLWMGGLCPLGYDAHPDPMVRELVVNHDEAETVRKLFILYDQHGRLSDVERRAADLGFRSKRRSFRSGNTQGGGRLGRGQIHHVLVNPVYLGKIRHKDQVFLGRHPAIVEEKLWTRVQDKLQAAAARQRGQRKTDADTAPLTRKLQDETGDRLTPTHCTKAGRRHRYYVSNRLIAGGPDPAGWRLPASQLETLIATAIADHLEQAAAEHRLRVEPDLTASLALQDAARNLARPLRNADADLLRRIVTSATIAPRQMRLALNPTFIAKALDVKQGELAPELTGILRPFQLHRRGVEARVMIGAPSPISDRVLLKALREAHRWADALRSGTAVTKIARDEGRNDALIRSRGQLAFLAPKIQIAILDGTLPPELTLKRILRQPIPLDWDKQARLFGV